MLTSIAAGIAQNVVMGWLWRRVQEIASLAGVFIPIYLAMPPSMQQDVQAIFTGKGGGLTISAAVGIVWYLWTQWQSYRATVRPQVVTTDGQKITPVPTSVAMERVEAQAKAAPKSQTLWERLTGQ
jgi:hypothetical protein